MHEVCPLISLNFLFNFYLTFSERRQTTLGAMPYAYIIATSLQTLFSYLKQSLGQFTYLSSQLLNLYQILPVQPNVSTG